MKENLKTLAVPVIGILLLPFVIVSSVVLGEYVFDWAERRHKRRQQLRKANDMPEVKADTKPKLYLVKKDD